VALDEGMGGALGRLTGAHQRAHVEDLSELGGSAAHRRFMAAFAEKVYRANSEPQHLVLDEADLWVPLQPLPEAYALLGRIEEIVRRGRVRGFIPGSSRNGRPSSTTTCSSQADVLVAMKLAASQDRDAIDGWIEGQADLIEGKRTLPSCRASAAAWAISGRPGTMCSPALLSPASAPPTAPASHAGASGSVRRWCSEARRRRR